ncbi:endochitinase A1-like isoform X2, partial [Clarias magur]
MLTKRMAMRRMNEMWRRMALTLVFCVLLFHTCQGESTEFSTSTSTITSFTKVSENTINENSTVLNSTVATLLWSTPTTATTVASTDLSSTTSDKNLTTTEANKVNNHTDSSVQVSEELQNHSTVQGSRESQTDTTTTTERAHDSLVTSNATTTQNVVHITSKARAKGNAGESVELNNEIQQGKISKVNEEGQTSSPPQGNSKNVFVPILVCGLVLAAALIGLYIKRNHCPTSASGGMKL